ncbi:MAG: vWA domain-containing protein [Planctomycetaceae bacterium]|nr:vWA domain-containing protein [Planctomycetaceae bacterium]
MSNARKASQAEAVLQEADGGAGLVTPRERPAWVMSLAVHVGGLLLLASLTHVTLSSQDFDPVDSVFQEFDPDDYSFDTVVVETLGNQSDIDDPSPSQAASTTLSKTPQQEFQERLDEKVLTVKQTPTAEIPLPPENEFADVVDVQGQTENPGGIDGAVDRMAVEIDRSLQAKKTLVIWLFDESGSMAPLRNAIADRVEAIYKQLGALKDNDSDSDRRPLKTAVVGYSDKTTIYTPKPIDDAGTIVKTIRAIKSAKSPDENVFTAVAQVSNKWLSYRRRMGYNVMVVVVTDERGTDYGADGSALEKVIRQVRTNGIRVYCIGNAAVFGREHGYVSYTFADGFTDEFPVDQGPESVMMERMALPFWGTRGFGRYQMSSGYGPYALNRLCSESKGIYLIANEGKGAKFNQAVMRGYRPDYRPIRMYVKDLEKNLAKRSLVRAATLTREKRIPVLGLTFNAENDNVLRRVVTEAQKPVAELDFRLKQLQFELEAGEAERGKLTQPRWQAGFDLALGRVLAMRVRAFGYNVVLAQMKSQPKVFQKKDSNIWRLKADREITSGGAVKKLHKKAREYLNRVVDQHAGTPWALLAERELSTPMGWVWVEGNRPATSSGNRKAANDPNRVLFVVDPKTGKKKRVMPNKPRPRPPL